MKAIGGYFELELRQGGHYHQEAIRLNTARNSFEYVLRSRQYTKVYIPYYTCEVMLEPINKLGIEVEFYHINESLEPLSTPLLKMNEAFLYTNYFGLKQNCVKRLADVYGERLVVDNAQAFFAEPIRGIDTFYSVRKFFGVPDGAFLYTTKKMDQEIEQDVSYERMSHLLKRVDLGAEAGYMDFRNNDDALCNQPVRRMSKLTEAISSGIDFEASKQQRRTNYTFLDNALNASNRIHLALDSEAVPMVYPYWTDDASLRQKLIKNKVFVATYWPNVKEWAKEGMLEYELAEMLIPIPVDQRYGVGEMREIIDIVVK